MFPQIRLSEPTSPYSVGRLISQPKTVLELLVGPLSTIGIGIKRRWRRERRRRKVARAYDMALEIARVIPRGSQVLDVGCGNGFIAHHLSAMLGRAVIGIDLADSTEAPIEYRQYSGREFPVAAGSFDGVILAYVLHHAQDVSGVLSEIRRALRPGGVAVIYEDIPDALWDRFICWTHDRKWRKRTGACRFRSEFDWRSLFKAAGFAVIRERQLARLRNVMHPVRRRFYLLQLQSKAAEVTLASRRRTTRDNLPDARAAPGSNRRRRRYTISNAGESLELIRRRRKIAVVVEKWAELRVLRKEGHYRKALIVKALVHVAATLLEHHFDLAFRGSLHKDASDQSAKDDSDNADNCRK